jgi:fido (protein-threonine AMPylation protein)
VTPLGGQPDGATPLTAEDMDGLKASWISTQAELNQAEAENILGGRLWASRVRRRPFWHLRDAGLQELHRRMFGDVWTWAGRLRQSEANIGIDPHRITVALRVPLGAVGVLPPGEGGDRLLLVGERVASGRSAALVLAMLVVKRRHSEGSHASLIGGL